MSSKTKAIKTKEYLVLIHNGSTYDKEFEGYKPIRTKSTPNGNYIEYERKRDKNKNLLPKEYFDQIKPYLSDIINNHKTQFVEWKILQW